MAERLRPGLTPESEENQAIALAMNLAKKQLQDGTASSQVITHFLKLGTAKYELEKEKLAIENQLTAAKKESIEKQAHSDELYQEALRAFASYSGHGDPDDY